MTTRSRSPLASPLMALASSIALAAFAPARPARADHVYEYRFDRPVYLVNPGETFEVRVSLRETVTGNDASLLATEGLIGAGVRVKFDNPPAPGAPAVVASLGDILPNTAQFDDPFGLDTDLAPGSSAGFTESVQITSPQVYGTAVSPGEFAIDLGVFRFTAGSVPGETTFLSAIDRSASDETISGVSGIVLDASIRVGSSTIEVRSVPEPSAFAACSFGLGIVGLLKLFRSARFGIPRGRSRRFHSD